MDTLTISLVFVVGIFLGIEVVKHHLFKKWREFLVLLILVFILLFSLSNYIDIGKIFSKDNPVSATGHTIFKAVKENFKDVHITDSLLNGVESKTKEFVKKII